MRSIFVNMGVGVARAGRRSQTAAAEPVRLRTEAEKAALRAICGGCEFNADGICRGSNCCGGRVPVEVKLNLSVSHCPKSKW